MVLFLLVLGTMAFTMLAMAVGVILKRPCLRGSCGGPSLVATDGEPLDCGSCPRRGSLG